MMRKLVAVLLMSAILSGLLPVHAETAYVRDGFRLQNTAGGIVLTEPVDKTLTSYTLPQDVTAIGEGAFEGCANLRQLTIPYGVSEIGPRAFANCTSLQTVHIPFSVTAIGESAFYNCVQLWEITLPDYITRIENNTFTNCISLPYMEIPHNVTYIGKSAFEMCSGLGSVSLPVSLTKLGERAFFGCSNLYALEIPEGVTELPVNLVTGCKGLSLLSLPRSMTRFGYSAYGAMLPEGVTLIVHKGSAAEAYARAEGLPYTNPLVLPESESATSAMMLFNDGMSWPEAKAYCESLGGHLVTINSIREQSMVEDLIHLSGEKGAYWIGLYDNDTMDGWQWITGEPVAYTNWRSGEPVARTVQYGQIYGGIDPKYEFLWDAGGNLGAAYSKDEEHGFICEWDEGMPLSLPAEILLPADTPFRSCFAQDAGGGSKELMMVSAKASKAVYNRNDIRKGLEELGFDTETIVQEDYDCLAPHSVGVTIAHQIVRDGQGNPVTLYAVIVRGTEGTLEWISDFEVGGGDVSLGFDEAAKRVMGYFEEYVRDHPPLQGSYRDGKYKVWLTGHSRGAAVANLMAGRYLKGIVPAENVYCYGFATPNVARNTTRDNNIINFVIDGDVVPRAPLSEWGFYRYGLTVYYSNDKVGNIKVNSPEDMDDLVSLLLACASTQAEYAEMTADLFDMMRGLDFQKELDLVNVLALILYYAVTEEDPRSDGYRMVSGTALEVLLRLAVNSRYKEVINLFFGDLAPEKYQTGITKLLEIIMKVGDTHSMDTYLVWIEDIYYNGMN